MSHRDVDDSFWSGLPIDPDSAVPVYVQAAYLMRGVIMERELPVGALLPSENTLSARWGVSRETVRKAYAWLVELGIAGKRRGVGYFIRTTPKIAHVSVPAGTRISARPMSPYDPPHEPALLPLSWLLVVEAPGQPAATYNAATTHLHAG